MAWRSAGAQHLRRRGGDGRQHPAPRLPGGVRDDDRHRVRPHRGPGGRGSCSGLNASSTAQQMLVVCNACRYCEQFCPVFPAIERRTAFAEVDLHYLANLCHNCGECLYACQYAPPHPFGVNVPRMLAEVRRRTYEHYCWPPALAAVVPPNRRQPRAGPDRGIHAGVVARAAPRRSRRAVAAARPADFYAVVPHAVWWRLFGLVLLFALVALGVSLRPVLAGRYGVGEGRVRPRATWVDALPTPCHAAAPARRRRGLHHRARRARAVAALGPSRHAPAGFALCLCVHDRGGDLSPPFGWTAPHGYLSVPVVLGAAGGVGLVCGPLALLLVSARGETRRWAIRPSAAWTQSLLVLLLVTSCDRAGAAGVPSHRGDAAAARRCTSAPCWRSSSRSRTASSCTGSTACWRWCTPRMNRGATAPRTGCRLSVVGCRCHCAVGRSVAKTPSPRPTPP